MSPSLTFHSRFVAVVAALLLAACSPPQVIPGTPAPEGAGTTTASADGPVQSFTWDGRERSYRVHLPAGYDESRAYPLLLVLHAAYGTAERMAALTGFDELADERGFVVAYGDGTAWGARNTQLWNAGQCCAGAADNDIDDVGYAREVVTRLSQAHRIAPDRVFATGLSNGGMMVQRLACDASDVFRGIAAVAGSIQATSCKPSRQLRVLLVHGTADSTVPYRGGPSRTLPGVVLKSVSQNFSDWARLEGCDGDLITETEKKVDFFTFQHCDQPVQLVRINGGGHTWPRGASKIITDFFQL